MSVRNSHVAEHTGTCGGRLTELMNIPLHQWETLRESWEVESDLLVINNSTIDLVQGKMRA